MKNFNALSKRIFSSTLLKPLSLTFIATIALLSGYAQTTITAAAGGGAWNNTATWVGGVIPTQGNNDQVTIPAGVTVTVPTGYNPTAVNVTVSGTLNMSGGTGTTLEIGNSGSGTGSLTVNAGGTLTIGTNTVEFMASQSITGITNNGTINAAGSTVQLNSNSGATFTIDGTVTLNNIENGPSGDGNYHIDVNSADGLTITGTLTANGANSWGFGFSGNAPIWAVGSTFYWNRANQGLAATGGFGLAWDVQTGTAGVTPGYPYNVTLVNLGSSEGDPLNYGVGWCPTGAIGLAGTLQIGDGTTNGRVSLESVSSFSSGGIIVNNNSFLAGPPTAATFTDQGNFTLTGATTGQFISDGAAINFDGSGTFGSPQTISTSAANVPFANMTVSNGTYVNLGSPVSISGTLTLTSGYIGTNTNALTIDNTAATAVSVGSATAYIDGPLSWSIPATTTASYVFPIGDKEDNGGSYLPLTLSPNTTSGATVTATAFNKNSNGSPSASVTSISSTEYWELQTSSPFSSGPLVSVTRNAAVTTDGTNALAESSTANGSYTAIGGTASGSSVTGGGVGTSSPEFIAMVKAPLSVVKLSGTNVVCNSTTGSLTVGGSGGTPPYTYSDNYGLTYQGSGTFSPLNPGSHSIWVKDNTGTIDSANLIVQGSLQINGNDQPVTICIGGSTTLTAANLLNSSPTYSWSTSPTGTPVLPGGTSASYPASPAVTTEYYVSSLLYNNNLLTNGDFEDAVEPTGFTSTYTYDPGADYGTTPGTGGYYSVTNASNTLCEYFTINNAIGGPTLPAESGGQYFVADGPVNATTVSWSENLTGLTAGTTYQFKFWYASADPYGVSNNPPNWAVLHPTATNGTLTGADVTANTASAWTQASYTFVATGTTTTISISDITNIGTPDGNDFLLDNIQFLSPCPVTDSIEVIVNPATTITLTSAAGTNSQTVCLDAAITNITYSVVGGATGVTVTGLPAGVTYAYNTGTDILTISGAPTTGTGTTFTYTITPTGGCTAATKTGTIAINTGATLTYTSGSTAQTVCVNSAIGSITYTIGGSATGATVTGLPAGVTSAIAGNVVTISGTPTTAGAALTYTVTTTGGCGSQFLTGTIAVTAAATVTLTSGSAAQTVCVNSAIGSITYTIGGSATGATVTGLPAGVTSGIAGNVVTISGTPTTAGAALTYTVTTTGGCGSQFLTGTIAVNAAAAVTLTSGSAAQTVCINTAIGAIKYTIGGSATGATVTGLPAGVTSGIAGNVVTISGTPTTAGAALTYTVTTTGGCGSQFLTGTIAVTAAATVTLTSGSAAQTVCINTAIGAIKYTIGGSATGATVTGLPAGVTSGIAGNVVTISGTPTTAGAALTYTVTTTGGCGSQFLTGTIAVTAAATVTLASGSAAQTVCVNSAIGSITYTIGSGATGATVTGLPAGVTSGIAGNVVTISGTPTTAGAALTYTVTTTGGCGSQFLTGTITVNPILQPTVSCGTTTTTTTPFNWTAVAGAVNYTLSYTVNGVPAASPPATTLTNYTVTGLTPGDAVVLTVTPTGTGCFAAGTGTCTAIACSPITTTVPANSSVCTGATIPAATFVSTPAGATFAWTNNTTSIGLPGSGTGNAIGSFTATNVTTSPVTATITVTPTIGACAGTPNSYTIMVNPNATLALTSGSPTQTVCINTAIAPISYTIGGGATNATLTGAPAGITGSLTGSVFTVSGTPTTAGSGTTYTVTTTGTCTQQNLTGSITVNALTTPTFAAIGPLCQNSVAPTLPATSTNGITGTWNPATINTAVSGGPVTYTFTPTAGQCAATTTMGITINPLLQPTVTCGTISTSSVTFNWNAVAGATNYSLSYSINSGAAVTPAAITATTYTVSGLNPGDAVAITVTPTAATGCFAPGMGNCAASTCTPPTVTVPANSTICNGALIATVALVSNPAGGTFTWTNSDPTIGLAGLGSGNVPGFNAVNATTSPKTATINVTPTVGGCIGNPTPYTITINPDATLSLTSGATTQTVCINTAIAPITYTIGGGATNATLTGAPAGITGSLAGSVFTVSGTPTTAGGATTYTVATTGTCAQQNLTGSITVNALTTPTFAAIGPLCLNSVAPTLPATSTNGITGTWNPATINTAVSGGPVTYTFTPTAGQCAATTTMGITINPLLQPNISCGASTTSSASFNWPAVTGATNYTITYSVNGGAVQSGGSIATNAYTVNGLSPSEPVSITVTPTGPGCFASNTGNCSASNCPTPTSNVPANSTVCNGGAIPATNFTSNPAGATFTWINSNPAIGIAGNGTGNIPAFNAINTSGSPITATIAVSASNGICTGPANSYTITVNPDATLALTSPNPTIAQSVCVNSPITSITYAVGGGGTNATVTGLPAGVTGTYAAGVVTISGTPTVTAGSPYGYTVTTTGTCTQQNLTGSITVNVTPTITITPANPTTCGGTDGSLTIGGLTTGAAYTVNFSMNGAAQASQNLTAVAGSVTITNLAQGNYSNITVTTASGCLSTNSVAATLTDPMPPTATASNNGPICSGATLNLNVTTTVGATYTWTGPNGFTSGIPNPTIPNAQPNNSGLYNVTVTLANCPTPTSTTATVNPTPVLQVNNPAAVCTPNTVDLTAAAVTAGSALPGGTSLTYYTDPGATNPISNPSAVAPPPPGATDYIQAVTGFGCADTAQVLVTINQTPNAPTSDGPQSLCTLPPVPTLTAGATAPAGSIPVWYDALTGGNTVSNPDLNIYGTITYYAESDPPSGCNSYSRTSVTLTIVHPPTVTVQDSTINVDFGYTVQLNGTVTPAAGDHASYFWNPTTDMTNIDSLSPLVNPTVSTYYILTGTSLTYGCTATATVHVTVLKPIQIPNAFSPNNDGVHDTWYIQNLEQYPAAEVDVFNRYGQFVFQAQGNYLEHPWDGTYNGAPVPIGEYYYIIKLNSGTTSDAQPISGGVSVIR